jgi:hypothetical protein
MPKDRLRGLMMVGAAMGAAARWGLDVSQPDSAENSVAQPAELGHWRVNEETLKHASAQSPFGYV